MFFRKPQALAAMVLFFTIVNHSKGQNGIIVFQSDFGVKDGAVSAMKGVAIAVSPALKLYDLTHEIPPYNIWEASYRLEQTVPYWPPGTVFVSVVDPGVGTTRKSVVVKLKTGQFIVTPDNGTLTHLALTQGIDSAREIDEAVNRRKNSESSYTFHGRDVYAYTAARLAGGVIKFSEVGRQLPREIVSLPFQYASMKGNIITGTIPILDVQYGNVWTNIPSELLRKRGIAPGTSLNVRIFNNRKLIFTGRMPFVETFGSVKEGHPLAYLNSLLQLSFAINMGDFAGRNKIASGNSWYVEVEK